MIVNVNKKYSSDVTLGNLALNMSRGLGTAPPRDYILRIKWKAEKPIEVEGGMPELH